ncbi:DUF2334 domain-containing protein [Dactylosporangium sp. AC04546]|uniref:DUF2334 domain-containing protein n=1 Tax=Dactylosporangium sp. AC04546 TaxID=2862460 RepID=UPI001EDE8B5E|nr:DUF2334 domain-containing protein [Dactylosporangium sp. AC04546]WVK84331.1 DUF2334 domain-containing protein [Dactylosporangium sp. AC04546]
MRTVVKLVGSAVVGTILAGGLSTAAHAAAPAVIAVTPKNGSTGVSVAARPTITFSEATDPASLRYSFVKTAGGAAVPAYYTYDAPTHTFTFQPRAALAESTRYTLTVKVKDTSGVLSDPYIWAFTTGVADRTAPSAPGQPVVSDVGTTSATLTWPAATDNVGVTGYRLFNGSSATPIATVDGISTTLSGLAPSAAHSITVKAVDAAGNVSAASAAVEFTTLTPPPPPDTSAPSRPGAPTAGTVTPSSAALRWAASSDDTGVVSYRISGGPQVVTATATDVTIEGLEQLTQYTFTVEALDAAGNASQASEPVTVTTPARPLANARSGAGIPGATGRTLVLYDTTGPYGFLGEQYAIATANLASHFGDWTAQPVVDYQAGELDAYQAVIYLGSTYDEPLPVAFLDDVTATTKPVVWVYDNIWQLTARDPNFGTTRGFTWTSFDVSSVSTVNYKGRTFTRDPQNGAGIMGTTIYDTGKVSVVGDAVRADSSTLPWAVRSGNFWYLGEVPYAYISADDRYVAFADMLYDVLDPQAAERHRALVRIEDVGPDADPAELRRITDYLYGKGIPFTVAVYSRYRDPNATYSGGAAEDYTLADRPAVVAELKYMESHGGTLLMHGYTHQFESAVNPYNGVSADDFEFYMAHVNEADSVIYDGAVPGDSQEWAQSRIDAAFAEFAKAGLKTPTIFEFPHYAGSDLDNRAVAATFQRRYDRGLYGSGALRGGTVEYSRIIGQFFPYTVRDIYGVVTVPENLGNIELEPFNNHPAHLPADIIASAQLNLAVRDGVASFFFHPYVDVSYLRTTVEGVLAAGYTFVPASSM